MQTYCQFFDDGFEQIDPEHLESVNSAVRYGAKAASTNSSIPISSSKAKQQDNMSLEAFEAKMKSNDTASTSEKPPDLSGLEGQ